MFEPDLPRRRAGAALVRDGVVALGVGADVPAVGRGRRVLGVGEDLEALNECLLLDREDAVLQPLRQRTFCERIGKCNSPTPYKRSR